MSKGYIIGLTSLLVVAAVVVLKSTDRVQGPSLATSAPSGADEAPRSPASTEPTEPPSPPRPQTLPPDDEQVSYADPEPPRELTAFNAFEIRQICFLQRMTKEMLGLDAKRAMAVDRVFADFIRRILEDRPKPVFLSYTAAALVDESGEAIPGVHPAGMTVDDDPASPSSTSPRTLTDENGNPVYLVQQIVDQLAPEQEAPLRALIPRWNALRSLPVDGPLRRLQRVILDPGADLTDDDRNAALKALRTVRKALPPHDRRKVPPEAAANARAAVLSVLTPEQGEKLLVTLAMLDEHREAFSTGDKIRQAYADAVNLLDGDASGGTTTAP